MQKARGRQGECVRPSDSQPREGRGCVLLVRTYGLSNKSSQGQPVPLWFPPPPIQGLSPGLKELDKQGRYLHSHSLPIGHTMCPNRSGKCHFSMTHGIKFSFMGLWLGRLPRALCYEWPGTWINALLSPLWKSIIFEQGVRIFVLHWAPWMLLPVLGGILGNRRSL